MDLENLEGLKITEFKEESSIEKGIQLIGKLIVDEQHDVPVIMMSDVFGVEYGNPFRYLATPHGVLEVDSGIKEIRRKVPDDIITASSYFAVFGYQKCVGYTTRN